jgi:hypothetical protein
VTIPIPTVYPRPSMHITHKLQERIKAEGWRPPVVVLDTVEAVGNLPLGSVVLSGVYPWHKDRMGWFRTGRAAPGTPAVPVTVLYTPEDVG